MRNLKSEGLLVVSGRNGDGLVIVLEERALPGIPMVVPDDELLLAPP